MPTEIIFKNPPRGSSGFALLQCTMSRHISLPLPPATPLSVHEVVRLGVGKAVDVVLRRM